MIAEDARHYVHLSQPDLAIDAIREVRARRKIESRSQKGTKEVLGWVESSSVQ